MIVGWSTRSPPTANSGFGHSPNPQLYDARGTFGEPAGGEGVSVKAKVINLIGATRTLMRIPLIVVNSVIIVYEVILG
nr:hypothetical protein L204_03394 [Cryptococcus depauperatus CBS 7855]